MAGQFKWIDSYTELATKLLAFKNNRKELIRKIQKVFPTVGIKLPKLGKDNLPADIDPFTVFGLFNKGITEANRISILKGIKAEFGLDAEVPENFDGIPLLNNLKATFYYFEGDRDDDDIDNLWVVFDTALAFAESDTAEHRETFSVAYDRVLSQKSIRWNITMGLYWVRPYCFINLDSRNRWYMRNPEHMPANVVADIAAMKAVPSAAEYLKLRDKCLEALQAGNYEYKTFPELSYTAWLVSEEDNQREKDEEQSGKSKAAFLRWFKPIIIALRDLGGSATPTDTRKKIIENEHLTADEISATRGRGNVNKFENEVAFARSYLVKGGYIDNSVTGIWTLTEKGMTVDMTDDLASEVFKNGVTEMTATRKEKNALGDADVKTQHYWLYAPGEGASKWEEFYSQSIMGIGWREAGDLSVYTSKKEIKQALRENRNPDAPFTHPALMLWQFVNEMKPGDVVFVKKGRTEILGRGIVESEYEYDEEHEGEYPNIHHVKWTHKGHWQLNEMFAMKTLTDITNYPELVGKISAFFDDEAGDEPEDNEPLIEYPTYTMEDFLDEVYISENAYNTLVGLLRSKMNIILEGAPGVGKTFVAKRLAYSIMGVKDVDRVMMVQFHQSYSYEDFIMGFRPSGNGFDLKKGAFYNFCKKAEIDSDHDYFFIIDEINRGNLSKIFGELFMLIENDKRGSRNKVQLLYSDELFYVPDNVYIIGMMNTADRSLAMLDYALRRRFAFFDLVPGFSSDGFKEYQSELDSRKFDALIQCVVQLNERIAADESLGEGFCIGHSYFSNLTPDEVTDAKLSGIVEYELIPLLKEYWFDEPLKVREWSDRLRSAVK